MSVRLRCLVVVPTELERQLLGPLVNDVVSAAGGRIDLCGFGPIASGIRTTRLLSEFKPDNVILAGIAGTYTVELPVGTAATFSQVGCYGIGAGSGSSFRSASHLGWQQWHDAADGIGIGDVIDLPEVLDGSSVLRKFGMLLTVCSASGDPVDVMNRQSCFPLAAAEDMEAFAVAMACRAAGVPMSVIRGISNIAGDRDKRNWNIRAALHAVAAWFVPENLV